MPFSPEQMPQKSLTQVEETARLKEKIDGAEKIYGRIRPHLAISWPLTPLRKEAFQMAQNGEVNEKVRSFLEHHKSPIERILWEKIADAIKGNEPIAKIDAQREKMLRLLASKNPAFASLETEALIGRLKTIEDIVQKLQKTFGENFIGITVYGSTAKGHMIKESDLDFTVIAYDKEIRKKFQKMLWENKIEACPSFDRYLELSQNKKLKSTLRAPLKFFKFLIHGEKKHTSQSEFSITSYAEFPVYRSGDALKEEYLYDLAPLFHGLFFGDRKTFLEVQLSVLEKLNPALWDRVRRVILTINSSLLKAQRRFGFTDDEAKKIRAEICILRTPPPYEEALEFIRDQVGKIKEK